MAFTTLAALSSAIYGLSVAGITRKIQYRPQQIDAADLPLSYARLPTRKREISTLTYGQGLKYGVIEWVFLTNMLNLDTQPTNDAEVITLIDAIGDVLETNASALGMDAYEIVTDEDTIDGTSAVQAIIVTVEVSG